MRSEERKREIKIENMIKNIESGIKREGNMGK